MNFNQISNMLTRMVMNKLMNWGIRKGMKSVNSRGGVKRGPQEAQLDKTARQAAKRARQAAKITRRLGR